MSEIKTATDWINNVSIPDSVYNASNYIYTRDEVIWLLQEYKSQSQPEKEEKRVYLARGSKYKLEGEDILRDPLIDEHGRYYYIKKEPVEDRWISVEDKPLVSYCSGQDNEGKLHEMWQVNDGVPDEFLAALRYNDKKQPGKELWWIRHCVIEDETGLCIVGDDLESIPAGWEINDVEFYMPLPSPPKSINNGK